MEWSERARNFAGVCRTRLDLIAVGKVLNVARHFGRLESASGKMHISVQTRILHPIRAR